MGAEVHSAAESETSAGMAARKTCVWAIIVAAGRGERFGSMKQLELLGGRTLVEWSLGLFSGLAKDGLVEGIALVAPPGGLGDYMPRAELPGIQASASGNQGIANFHVVAGGDSRSASVRSGLSAVPESAEIVVVHDVARPLASPDLVRSVIDAVCNGASAAVPALDVVDTIKEVEDGRVLRTLDRTRYVTVQTPQAFRADTLRRAHELGHDATDDATLVEMIGEEIATVPGEKNNIKVTTPDDLVRLNHLAGNDPLASLRIGNGFDMHRFGNRDSHLVLGGIRIPHNKSLMGHSDADVLTHAVIDSMLGAAGLGDIGHHFPDTDPMWSGADSIEMLRQVVGMLYDRSYRVVNIDATVVAETPMLSPYIVSIQSRLGEITGGSVNVKATSPEGMGALGNEEGIACFASALIGTLV